LYPKFSEEDISNINKILSSKNMLGRISTWPVNDEYMYTFVATEYAVKWINGEVQKESVDIEVLWQLMEDYTGVRVHFTFHVPGIKPPPLGGQLSA
jgi:malate synthase